MLDTVLWRTCTRGSKNYFNYIHFECPNSVCSGVLDNTEYACYCRWFDHIIKTNPPKIDLIGEREREREGDACYCVFSLLEVLTGCVYEKTAATGKTGGEACHSG